MITNMLLNRTMVTHAQKTLPLSDILKEYIHLLYDKEIFRGLLPVWNSFKMVEEIGMLAQNMGSHC